MATETIGKVDIDVLFKPDKNSEKDFFKELQLDAQGFSSALKSIDTNLKKVSSSVKDSNISFSQFSSNLGSLGSGLGSLSPSLSSFGNSLRTVSSSLSAFSSLAKFALSPVGLLVAGVTALGFSLVSTAREIQKTRQELIDYFSDNERLADSLISSMKDLERVTNQTAGELTELSKTFFKMDVGVYSAKDASEYMKRFQLATKGSKEELAKIPDLFQRIEKEGEITREVYQSFSRVLGEDVVKSAKKFESQGMQASFAVKEAVKQLTGSLDELDSRVEDLFSADEFNFDKLTVELERFKENSVSIMSSIFSPLKSETEKWLGSAKDGVKWINDRLDELKYNVEFLYVDLVKKENPFEHFEKKKGIGKGNEEEDPDEKRARDTKIDIEGNIEYIDNLLKELSYASSLTVEETKKAGLRSIQEVNKSIAYTNNELIKTFVKNASFLKEKFPKIYSELVGKTIQTIEKGKKTLEEKPLISVKGLSEIEKKYQGFFDKLANSQSLLKFSNIVGLKNESEEAKKSILSIKEEIKKMAEEDLSKGLLDNKLLKNINVSLEISEESIKKETGKVAMSLQEKIGYAVAQGTGSLGSSLSTLSRSSNPVQGGISAGLGATQGALSIANMFKKSSEAIPVVGAIVGGVSALFDGIVALFGDGSQERRDEIEREYKNNLDSINSIYKQEINMRQKNLDSLNSKLNALSEAKGAGQLSAEEYYRASGEIGSKISSEELAKAKAEKIASLQRESVQIDREWALEREKWFPNGKRMESLVSQNHDLKNRIERVRRAKDPLEVNLAKEGALQKVNRPTLFMAGERGQELVNILPLKAGIDPNLAKFNSSSGKQLNQIFNIKIDGFIGNESELTQKLIKEIQAEIFLRGEQGY